MGDKCSWRWCLIVTALLTLSGASGAGMSLSATAAGSVFGRVADAATKAPLSGAAVVIENQNLRATTTADGTFLLAGVPEGQHEVVISYVGRRTERATVTVGAGATARLEVALSEEYTHKESVEVIGTPIEQGESRALNEQRTAVNIMNVVSADQIGAFPDPNVAEATQRVPGVSIQRDQGEGRYVMIRGTEPRLNSMMIDGERIPSPESDVRQVALDVIPADLLQTIQVSKAITPDMDGDSIGGSVNLIMKQATSKTRVMFSAGSGYNKLIGSADQSNATVAVGGRAAGGKLGLMLGGSMLTSSRGSDDFEPTYTADKSLASLGLRDYQVTRKRYGVNLAVDGRASDNTTLYLKVLGNKFSDQEYRQALNEKVTSNRLERQLKDRLETQHITSVAGRGQHLFSNGSTLEVRASTAYGDEGEPNHQDTTFRQSKVNFSPNVTPTSIDPNNIQANPLNENINSYAFNSAVITDGLTRDRDVVGSVDWRMPLSSGSGGASFLKFGAKYRAKHKFYDVTITNYASAATLPMLSYLDSGSQIGIYDGRYPMGSPIDAASARGLLSQFNLVGVLDHVKTDPANFDAHEDVSAGYGMAELYLGARTTLVPGVRYESTKVDYTGNRIQLDKSGNWLATTPVSGGSTSGVLMPMVHLRYAIDDSTNVRAAFTRTLARPDYADLVPRESVSIQNLTISQGNPALRSTTAWNYDLMFEHYFRSVGIVSAGLFAKQIDDYIYPFVTSVPRYGDTYRLTQPQNGDSASVRGLELAFQNQLKFLPGALAGIGLYANYTFTGSQAAFLGRGGDTGTLPGQARHVGNLSVWYERYGFSGRLSYNYHGSYLDGVGETAATDIYYNAHGQLDLSFSQSVLKKTRVFVDVMNLTNAPLRYYQAAWDRPIQNESYRWWMMAGVKFNF